jgi:hypothetical protein
MLFVFEWRKLSMGTARCRVSGCRNDALPNDEHCKKHTLKPQKVDKRIKHSEFVSDLLEKGSKKEDVNAIIREMDLMGATLEEIRVIANNTRRDIRHKQKELSELTKGGYEDSDNNWQVTNDIKTLQGKLKKLDDWIKHLQRINKIKKYETGKLDTEEMEHEQAVLETDENMDDGEWHDV